MMVLLENVNVLLNSSQHNTLFNASYINNILNSMNN